MRLITSTGIVYAMGLFMIAYFWSGNLAIMLGFGILGVHLGLAFLPKGNHGRKRRMSESRKSNVVVRTGRATPGKATQQGPSLRAWILQCESAWKT